MGKASSAKKVARAAGLGGGRAYGSRPPWGYYFAVLLLVVLGLVGVYNSREFRNTKISNAGGGHPGVNMATPWFEGFAVDACGKLLPPIKTTKNPHGITTKGDGVIYINPKTKSAAGKNATLGLFANSIGMTFNAAEIQVPGGHLYQAGASCEGKPGNVYVMTWSSPQALASDGVLQDKKGSTGGAEDTCNPDCDSGVRLENDQLVTIAFLPAPPKNKSLSVLQPPGSVITKLDTLVSTGGTTTTTTAIPITSTTGTSTTGKAGTATSGPGTSGTATSTTGKSKGGTTSTGTTAKGTTSTGTTTTAVTTTTQTTKTS